MMRHALQSGSRDPWAGTIPHEAAGRRGTRLLERLGGAENHDGGAPDSSAGPLPLPSAPAETDLPGEMRTQIAGAGHASVR